MFGSSHWSNPFYTEVFMRLLSSLCAVAALACAAQANAGVTVTATPGSGTYTSPNSLVYDFDTLTPSVTGGSIVTGTNAVNTQPVGSTGYYLAAGPAHGSSIVSLASFGQLGGVSFIWGSLDSFNTLNFLDASNNVVATFVGNNIISLLGGGGTANVNFTFTGADQFNIKGIQLLATTNAFEIDSLGVNAVPEPATWAMMILGFGLVGFAMRRRTVTTRVAFA
jgi:hypothetical protein